MSDETPSEDDVKTMSEWEAGVARRKATEEATLTHVLNEEARRAKESEDCAVLRAGDLQRIKADTRYYDRWFEMNSPKALREHRQLSIAMGAMSALIEDGITTGLEVEAFDIADRMMAEWERRKAATTPNAAAVIEPDDTEPSLGDIPQ